MDPLIIAAQVASEVVCTVNAFQAYYDYQGKYNCADLNMLSLKIECECISVALSQIHETLRNHLRMADQLTREDDGSATTFKSVLGACQLTFRIIEGRIKEYTHGGTNRYGLVNHMEKVKVVWNDREIKELAFSLSGVARGLDLLLTAMNLKSNFEVHEALTNQRASVIVEKVIDDARSLRSSYHLTSSDDPYLQIQIPSPTQNELCKDLLIPKCVHGKNKSTERGLEHANSAPFGSGAKANTDSNSDARRLSNDALDTVPPCVLEYNDAQISALVSDRSRWLEGNTLYLTDQNFTSLEPHWIHLIGSKIERLNLGFNLLTSLPDTFSHFHRLLYLGLKKNQFVRVPNLICRNLEVLDLSYNRLTNLPAGLAHSIRSLKVLRLEHNKIERLPYDMCKMKTLLKLSIHGNPLVDPSRDFIESLCLEPSSARYNDSDILFTKVILKHLKLRLASIINCPDEEKEKIRYELFELCPLMTLKMIGDD